MRQFASYALLSQSQTQFVKWWQHHKQKQPQNANAHKNTTIEGKKKTKQRNNTHANRFVKATHTHTHFIRASKLLLFQLGDWSYHHTELHVIGICHAHDPTLMRQLHTNEHRRKYAICCVCVCVRLLWPGSICERMRKDDKGGRKASARVLQHAVLRLDFSVFRMDLERARALATCCTICASCIYFVCVVLLLLLLLLSSAYARLFVHGISMNTRLSDCILHNVQYTCTRQTRATLTRFPGRARSFFFFHMCAHQSQTLKIFA